jgi:hypothetical protein
MPVILPEEHHESGLTGEAGKEVLVPFPAERMRAWPISPRVNSPKNNDAEIVVPIELASVARTGWVNSHFLPWPVKIHTELLEKNRRDF